MLITLWTRSSLELRVVVVVSDTPLVVVLTGRCVVLILTTDFWGLFSVLNWKGEGGTILSESDYQDLLVVLVSPGVQRGRHVHVGLLRTEGNKSGL